MLPCPLRGGGRAHGRSAEGTRSLLCSPRGSQRSRHPCSPPAPKRLIPIAPSLGPAASVSTASVAICLGSVTSLPGHRLQQSEDLAGCRRGLSAGLLDAAAHTLSATPPRGQQSREVAAGDGLRRRDKHRDRDTQGQVPGSDQAGRRRGRIAPPGRGPRTRPRRKWGLPAVVRRRRGRRGGRTRHDRRPLKGGTRGPRGGEAMRTTGRTGDVSTTRGVQHGRPPGAPGTLPRSFGARGPVHTWISDFWPPDCESLLL